MSGLGANFEYDLKKIIALSTLSQLGVIIRVLRIGLKELAFFPFSYTCLIQSAIIYVCGVSYSCRKRVSRCPPDGKFGIFYTLN